MPNDPNTTSSADSQNFELQADVSESMPPEPSEDVFASLETGEGIIRESWEETSVQFTEPRGDGSYTARFFFQRDSHSIDDD